MTFCPSRAPDGVKIEADYRVTFTTAEEELVFTLRLEQLVDCDRQLGAAEGRWTIASTGSVSGTPTSQPDGEPPSPRTRSES